MANQGISWCWTCKIPHPQGIAHTALDARPIDAPATRELERLVDRGIAKNIITRAGAAWMLSLS